MRNLFAAIKGYALAYAAMEQLQRREGALFPIGDRKTGVIGEFYARLYAAHEWPKAALVYGTPSERAWDITVRRVAKPDHRIQVKAVSSHSQTSRVSPIHPGWDELYLMRFNADFMPVGFLVLQAANTPWSNVKLGASTMPKRDGKVSSAGVFRGAVDKLDSLIQILAKAQG